MLFKVYIDIKIHTASMMSVVLDNIPSIKMRMIGCICNDEVEIIGVEIGFDGHNVFSCSSGVSDPAVALEDTAVTPVPAGANQKNCLYLT